MNKFLKITKVKTIEVKDDTLLFSKWDSHDSQKQVYQQNRSIKIVMEIRFVLINE